MEREAYWSHMRKRQTSRRVMRKWYQEKKNDLEKMKIANNIAIKEIEAKSEVERTDEERKMLIANEEKTNKKRDYNRKWFQVKHRNEKRRTCNIVASLIYSDAPFEEEFPHMKTHNRLNRLR